MDLQQMLFEFFGGLGIFIVKKTMDTVTYAYQNGENILTMMKKI